MKKAKLFLSMKMLLTLLAFFAFAGLQAQPASSEVILANDVVISPNVVEFDLYVKSTNINGGYPDGFPYGGGQYRINFNQAIRNGANTQIFFEMIAGSTELSNTAQVPPSVTQPTLTNGYVRLTGPLPVSYGLASIISNTGNGTKIVRMRMTSRDNTTQAPVPFTSGAQANLTLSTQSPGATTTSYVLPTGTTLFCTPQILLNNQMENLPLNVTTCEDPDQFMVSGGGSYCEGGVGVPVGLDGSQTGVNYTLLKDGIQVGSPVAGSTGNTLTFGNQLLAGTYTVSALSDGTDPGLCPDPVDMIGGADVIITPLEYSEVSITADPPGPVCANTIVTFTASPVNGGVNPLYEWFVNSISQNTPSSDNTFSTALPDGDQVFVVMTPDITCSEGTAQSDIYTFEVDPTLPVSVSIEVDQNDICAGTSVTFTAIPVNGGSEPQYTWYVNGSGTPGNSEFTYVPADGDVVYVELLADITQMCLTGNPATSSTILMEVNPLLDPSVSITADPSGAVSTGTLVEFTADAVNGGSPTYVWYVNGSSFATTNPFSYVPANGDQIYVDMTSTEECITSQTAQSNTIFMVVNDVVLPPAAFGMTGGGEYCTGDPGVVVGLSGSEPGVTYTLYQDANAIGSFPGTGAALDFGARFAGSYTASGTNSAGTTPMNGSALVIENALPVIEFAPLAGVCVGSGDVTLFASPAGGTFSGEGVTGNVFTPSLVGSFDITYNYTDAVTGCIAVAVTRTITVNPYPEAAGTISGASPVTEGDFAVVYSVNPIADALSYVWSYSGTGVTINGSGPAVTLDFAIGATSGQLSVYGVNGCGDGIASFFDIFVEQLVVPCPDFSTWNGSVSEDWFNAANWTPELVPCENTEVMIGEVAPGNFNPTIEQQPTNAVACLVTITDLTIADGGSLIGQHYLCVLNPAVVERTILNSNFHLISSPVDAITFGEVFLPIYWDEVWARKYDEPSGDWMNQNILDNLHVGLGYSVQMTTAPQTATFTGMLNGSDITRTLSNMNPGTDLNRIGWNLLGNPFPSAIDWDVFSTGDYDGQVAVWDEVYGNYRKWNGTTGDLPGGIIPAQQGFFVKTSIDGAALTIPLGAQLHNPMNLYKDAVANALELRANGNNYGDATFVHFNSNATADFDSQYDAFKLEGLATAPQLYNMAAGYKLSINELPFEGNEVVNLGFKCGVAGTYSLNASGLESFSSSTPILLEDLKLNVIQDLRLNPVYSFNYATNDSEARFKLHFKAATGIADPANSGIFVYSYEHTVVINNTTNLNGEIRIFDMTGRELKDAGMSAASETRLPLQVAVGTYIVKVTTARGTVNQKVYVK
ncbi:MAG: T9SS type A sorting domain-containing protein [Lentimicrobium sp.]